MTPPHLKTTGEKQKRIDGDQHLFRLTGQDTASIRQKKYTAIAIFACHCIYEEIDRMNTTHVHLLLNHVPVVGTLFGFLVLTLGCWRKSDELKKAALILFAIVAVIGIPAYLSGEPAEDGVKGLPGVSKAIVEKHEDAAAVAFTGVVVLGVLGVAGLIRYRRERAIPGWFSSSAICASLIVCGLMAWTANLGGQIRHTEIRRTNVSSAAPIVVAEKFSGVSGLAKFSARKIDVFAIAISIHGRGGW